MKNLVAALTLSIIPAISFAFDHECVKEKILDFDHPFDSYRASLEKCMDKSGLPESLVEYTAIEGLFYDLLTEIYVHDMTYDLMGKVKFEEAIKGISEITREFVVRYAEERAEKAERDDVTHASLPDFEE